MLKPLGITRSRLGKSQLKDRAEGEVTYHSPSTAPNVVDGSQRIVPTHYGGINLENMAAHGGWLASAPDLARFASSISASSKLSPLNSTWLNIAFAPPPIGADPSGAHYGFGWNVRPVTGGQNVWHTGAIVGTWSLLVHTAQGLTWAALFNRCDNLSDGKYSAIDGLLWNAFGAVSKWPTHDLYSQVL